MSLNEAISDEDLETLLQQPTEVFPALRQKLSDMVSSVCETCNKGFRNKKGLDMHIRIKHNERPNDLTQLNTTSNNPRLDHLLEFNDTNYKERPKSPSKKTFDPSNLTKVSTKTEKEGLGHQYQNPNNMLKSSQENPNTLININNDELSSPSSSEWPTPPHQNTIIQIDHNRLPPPPPRFEFNNSESFLSNPTVNIFNNEEVKKLIAETNERVAKVLANEQYIESDLKEKCNELRKLTQTRNQERLDYEDSLFKMQGRIENLESENNRYSNINKEQQNMLTAFRTGNQEKIIGEHENILKEQKKKNEVILKEQTTLIEYIGHEKETLRMELEKCYSNLQEADIRERHLIAELQSIRLKLTTAERREINHNDLIDTLQTKTEGLTAELDKQIDSNNLLSTYISSLKEALQKEIANNDDITRKRSSLNKHNSTIEKLTSSSKKLITILKDKTEKEEQDNDLQGNKQNYISPEPIGNTKSSEKNLDTNFKTPYSEKNIKNTQESRRISSLPKFIMEEEDLEDFSDDENEINHTAYTTSWNNNPHHTAGANMDPYAGYHLAGLTTNLKVLQPHELYRENIQGAQALNSWLRSIEVATPDSKVRARIALSKMDPEILERLGGNIHGIPWHNLKNKLFGFITPSTHDEAIRKLYQMEYEGHEHPATFYSMLRGYLRTLESTFPRDKSPSLKTIVRQCLLGGLQAKIRKYLNQVLNDTDSIDDFLNKFTRIYNDTPKNMLFKENYSDNINFINNQNYPPPHESNWYPNKSHQQEYRPSPMPPYLGDRIPDFRNTTNGRPPHNPYNSFGVSRPFPQQPNSIFNSHTTRPFLSNSFRDQCNANQDRNRPWLLWENWTCKCGEENMRSRATCNKCNQSCENQPEDCKPCKCGRRVYINAQYCFYCKSETNRL